MVMAMAATANVAASALLPCCHSTRSIPLSRTFLAPLLLSPVALGRIVAIDAIATTHTPLCTIMTQEFLGYTLRSCRLFLKGPPSICGDETHWMLRRKTIMNESRVRHLYSLGRALTRKGIFLQDTNQKTRMQSISVETTKEDSTGFTTFSNDGNEIRRRFLEFFALRGHIVLPGSSLVPNDPTVLLTIAGMLQFKPVFLGQVPRQVPRATTSQKCLRTNDVENVGRTARHHTFFEMLGNFSFGDYFKQDAIRWAWELAIDEFKLPVERVWVSVFEDDDEAMKIWRDEIGMPEERIKRMGKDDNFWASGPTGPCGPCSEMYYDFHPEEGTVTADLGDDSRFLEFYNLVFMQFNRKDDGSLELLKQKNIDTGLGLERMARILQNVPNNYETDLIFPIIRCAAKLAGVNYEAADDRSKRLLKVIGDHSRAVVYLISDGVSPSNLGRGYIVRRLIRRVVRMGRLLGIRGDGKGNLEGTFLPTLAKVAVGMSTEIDPDVKHNASRIYQELHGEELKFVQTLERGEKLLEQLLEEAVASEKGTSKPSLAGKGVFMLYDTYGYPIELTEEVAAERGVSIDLEGFEAEMEGQRKQSQAAHNVVKLSLGGAAAELSTMIPETEFLGYTALESDSFVSALLCKGVSILEAHAGDEVEVVLDRTPFYAESGGQIGDRGLLVTGGNTQGEVSSILQVLDVQKAGGSLFLHKSVVQQGKVAIGMKVKALVETTLRKSVQNHHTATHLLQAALKRVLGSEVSQAGSLVAFDRLRFDFNFSRPMTDMEIAQVENFINEWISLAVPLDWQIMPLLEAKKAGAIAMFGEKYGERVRVVNVPGISLELCGGTHVNNTSEIRGFKVISEQGIASGIRRIEAVAGSAYIDYVNARDNIVKQLISTLKVKADDLPSRITGLLEETRLAKSEAANLRAEVACAKVEALADSALIVGPANARVLSTSLGDVDPESLKLAAEHMLKLLGDPAAIILGSCTRGDKVSFVAAFSQKVVEHGLQAGNFVSKIARLCGGGGGGRPNFAQAGGKHPEKLTDALDQARDELKNALLHCSE
ncbi:hypothetical protein O6H91_18G038300 [Diphasiastrum complanatum]|uniref:Uncharacterized protein n=2 Tax=Diphasiastrum complanatum TaxID=34168 RepID=A0ACC2B012_DIPCM|nr:hypothetical protein O6H91_18G038300 [Diphasiastrum complanatum]